MLNKMYSLPELCFVGGSSENFEFNLYYDKSNPRPFDIYGGKAEFSIVNLANKNGTPIFSKSMEIAQGDTHGETDTCHNVVRVSLLPEDTVDLFGKFVYQVTLADADGNIDPHQGIVVIHRNINKTFIKNQ